MTKRSWKILAIFLAFVLVAAFLFSGFGSSWFTNGNFKTWFNSWGAGSRESSEMDDMGSSFIGSTEEVSGIKLLSVDIPTEEFADYGVSTHAETAEQLTVVIEPADADNKAITWAVEWADSSSAWASGKNVTSYVTITPTTEGALTAVASCLQPFGEQVIVTATSCDNSEYSISRTYDYVKRITKANAFLTSAYVDGNPAKGYNGNFNPAITIGDTTPHEISSVFGYTAGTVFPTVEVQYSIRTTEVFNSHNDSPNFAFETPYYLEADSDGKATFVCDEYFGLNFNELGEIASDRYKTSCKNFFIRILRDYFPEGIYSGEDIDEDAFISPVYLSVSYTATHDGKVISQGETTEEDGTILGGWFCFDYSNLSINVLGMSWSDGVTSTVW